MLRIANRHIGAAALAGIALAWLVLLTVDTFFALIGELGDIGRGQYQVSDALWYVALTTPKRAYNLFPTSAVVGSLLGLGGLAATSELVAYRAAGVSRLRISAAAVLASVTLLIPVMLIGEVVVPEGEIRAHAHKIQARSGDLALARSGLWVRDGETFFNARKPLRAVAEGNQLELADIMVYEFGVDVGGTVLGRATQAATGFHDGQRWRLQQVSQSTLDQSGVEVKTIPAQQWASNLDPSLLATAAASPSQLGIRNLLPYISYLKANNLDSRPYVAALWQRVAFPLSVIVMALAGMPFLFGSQRSGGLGQRMFIGMSIGVAFFIINKAAGSLGQVYDLNPAAAALLPSIAVGTLVLHHLRSRG